MKHDIGTLQLENIDLTLLEQQRVAINTFLDRVNVYRKATVPDSLIETLTGVAGMLDYWADGRQL